jgi:hypothetical protein
MKKLSKAQQRVLDKARTTPIVIYGSGEDATYRFQDGSSAHRRVLDKLIHDGLIIPNNDGLFPGFSQTYGAVR